MIYIESYFPIQRPRGSILITFFISRLFSTLHPFSACSQPTYATCRTRPSDTLPHIRWQAVGGWGGSVLLSLSISLHPPPRPEGVCSPRPYFFAPTGARQCHAYARWCRCDVYLYTAGLSNIKAATRTNEFLIALLMLAHRVVNHSRSRSFANEISC